MHSTLSRGRFADAAAQPHATASHCAVFMKHEQCPCGATACGCTVGGTCKPAMCNLATVASHNLPCSYPLLAGKQVPASCAAPCMAPARLDAWSPPGQCPWPLTLVDNTCECKNGGEFTTVLAVTGATSQGQDGKVVQPGERTTQGAIENGLTWCSGMPCWALLTASALTDPALSFH